MERIVGHGRILEVFDRLIKSERLAHAYLFVGAESVGKTTLIRSIVSQLLNVAPERVATHPDVLWLECPVDEKTGARKTVQTVDSIRDLRTALSMGSWSGGWRVAIIEDAAAMNAAAGNALLKILEEPPKRTLIVLRATRVLDLPATIVSRAQTIRCLSVPSSEIMAELVRRGASKHEAEELTALALGRPGIAFTLLSQRDVYKRERDHSELFSRALSSGVHERLLLAKHLLPKGHPDAHEEGEMIFGVWERVLREALLSSPEFPACRRFVRGLEALAESRRSLAHHTSLQLAFEHTLLHL